LTRKELYKEIKAAVILVFAIAVILVFTSLFDNKTFQKYFPIYLVAYIGTFILLHFLSSFIKNKYFDKFTTIISYPFGIISAILLVLIPFWTLLLHVGLYFGIAFLIPELMYKGLKYLNLVDFVTIPTTVYLKITLTVFISVLLNPLLRDIVYRISPARLKTSEKLKPYELGKLTDYFLSTENVKFFVYAFYVIALLTTNYFNFQGDSISSNIETDKSILQSFVTFIAFDRTFTLMKQLDFKPSGLLDRNYQSISNKVNNETTSDKEKTSR
jgi:hypothetical protein